MSKDWKGSSKSSVYTVMGATGHGKEDREENDFYATDPKAVDILLSPNEGNLVFPTKELLEPSAGKGHLAERLKSYGYNVTAYDLIDRGYCPTKNFFDIDKWEGSIITNPPYKYAEEFIRHALEIIPDGQYVAMFLKLTFLESKGRKKLFQDYPLKTLYVSCSRIGCMKNAELTDEIPGSAVAYGWYVWEKYAKDISPPDPIVKWIN